MLAPRSYDIILYGVTGYTGQLVADELLALAKTHGLSVAFAGRNQDKYLAWWGGRGSAAGEPPPFVVASSEDSASLRALAEQTRVLLTTVGPYARYGAPLVEACVAAGTDYADLTGEVPFIRDMIDRHHDEAQRTNARIVHAAGFDSIPSDLGVYLLQREALRQWGRPADRVLGELRHARGGLSGGTIASLLGVLEAATDPRVRRVLRDPMSLAPGATAGPAPRDRVGMAYHRETGSWSAPFLMAPVNTRVVRRSAALMPAHYGATFSYDEHHATGSGGLGMLRAAGLTAGLGSFMAAALVPPIRGFMARRWLPSPGEGPSPEARQAGSFRLVLHGRSSAAPDRFIEVDVRGTRDPGYGATAFLLAATGVALAQTRDASHEGGVLTPAAAVAEPLLALCEAEGALVRFEVRGG